VRYSGDVTAIKGATTQNIVELAEAVPDLSTLVTAIVAGNLANLLSTPGPFTVFAPNNEVWSRCVL